MLWGFVDNWQLTINELPFASCGIRLMATCFRTISSLIRFESRLDARYGVERRTLKLVNLRTFASSRVRWPLPDWRSVTPEPQQPASGMSLESRPYAELVRAVSGGDSILPLWPALYELARRDQLNDAISNDRLRYLPVPCSAIPTVTT